MIRLKNSILPVWFQWDGDEESLEQAKETIIDDIKNAGLTHYTTYVDIMDQPTEEDKDWDGISETVDKDTAKRTSEVVEEETTEVVENTAVTAEPSEDQVQHKSLNELETEAKLAANKVEALRNLEKEEAKKEAVKQQAIEASEQSTKSRSKSKHVPKKEKKKLEPRDIVSDDGKVLNKNKPYVNKNKNTGLPKGNTPNMDKFAVSEDETTTKTAS